VVEGARLESVFRGNSNVGSNPTLSATLKSTTYRQSAKSAGNGGQRNARIVSAMPLNLYRRHQQDCAGGHPEDSRSGEFEERSKKWKRCGCVIFAAGSLEKHFRRRTTGRIDWKDARAVASAWEAAGRWDAPAPPPNPKSDSSDHAAISFDKACSAFLAEHEKHSAGSTRRKYGILVEKLKAWSEHKGYVTLDQWRPQDIRECRDSWKVKPNTENRYMAIVRSFFEFAVDNEWLDRNPAKKVKDPKGREASDSRNEQKLPFTDAELQKMYDVCETQYGKMEIKWDKATHHKPAEGVVNSWRYKWTGRDLADFISVSVYTGLRISDVATFHASRMKPTGEITIRTTKTKTEVRTWIPVWLQDVIRRRSVEVGPFIFGEHETNDMNVITDLWRRKLNRLWKMCGDWKDKPTPHRFRHTFARILLERPGVSVRDVAELLGNTEAVVLKHYAAWVPGRQERLTSILKDAFTETPRPNVDNVVEMPSKTGAK
jgi:integrase